ncbi:MAG: hypothetical protein OXR66_08140 [Candidatus Woesearchaeota archaeon]|nr:hypothetical protein [Candidatus Woesearchaeota archaeon]
MKYIIFAVLFVVALVACNPAPEDTPTDTSDEAPTEPVEAAPESEELDLTSYKTMAAIMLLGKSVYCQGTSDAGDETVSFEYWLKGEQARAQSTFRGESGIVIMDGDDLYMQISKELKDVLDTKDCEWIHMTKGDEAATQDSSYKDPEDVDTSDFSCRFESIAASKFKVSGKVCESEALVPKMPEGVLDDIPDDVKAQLPDDILAQMG